MQNPTLRTEWKGTAMSEMQVWVCRRNIARFREQLAATQDERQRAILSGLLATHEMELARLTSTPGTGSRESVC
jgi:hypothetical protein